MSAKKVIAISIAVILSGCSTPVTQTKSIEDKFADIIRNSLKENALKNTADIKIYSLNLLHIDTITSNTLDSELIVKTTGRFELCNAMADLYLSMSETNARIKALDKKIKRSNLPPTTSVDIEDDFLKAQIYKDSAIYYKRFADSLNAIRIHNNRYSDTLYKIRSFLKATEKKDNDSTNYFGIRYFYITKNLKVLSVSDVEAGKLEGLIN